MLWFFRVAAILLTIPIAYALSLAFAFMLQLWALGVDWVVRYGLIKIVEARKPGAWDTLSDGEKQSLRALPNPQMLVSASQPIAVTEYMRALLHLFRIVCGWDQVALVPPAGASHVELNSVAEQSHHGRSPHNDTRGRHQTNTPTNAPRSNTPEAASHSADAKEALGPLEVADEPRSCSHHSGISTSHQAADSGREQDKSSWQIKANELPHFSVLLQSFMSLWARDIETNNKPKAEGAEAEKTEPRASDYGLCLAMHSVNLVTMTCFIFSIEKTILVSGISGVHTISTTGQLIPFVIGVASLMLAAQDLVMLTLKEKYSGWDTYHLAFQLGVFGIAIQVIDSSNGIVPEMSGPRTQTATDDTAS